MYICLRKKLKRVVFIKIAILGNAKTDIEQSPLGGLATGKNASPAYLTKKPNNDQDRVRTHRISGFLVSTLMD